MTPLAQVAMWPVSHAAAAVIGFDGAVETTGDRAAQFRLASLTKVITTWATLIAVEEGSITLDSPVARPGCTLRHLLSHAGGYPFDGAAPPLSPETRRIYSNTGIELAAAAVETATGMPFTTYLTEAILEPLGMRATSLRGSPAHAMWSTLDDMVSFVREIITPTLLDPATVAVATSIQFPDLAGRVPGVGTYVHCSWGLGVEIHGAKSPHWMGNSNSAETHGHFGGSGTMMWVDPQARVALVALTDRPFDEWADTALRVWPALSDAVVARAVTAD